MNYLSFKNKADLFLQQIFEKINNKNISIEKHWNIDHLCYRVSNLDDYEKLKKEFLNFSQLLIESEVNGRMISTFKLDEALRYKDWSINLIELPAPKVGKITVEGFEHIEVVIDVSFEKIKQIYSECIFDDSGLKKPFNKELEIELDQFAIKFHHLSLESVVNIEKNDLVYNAIKKLNILVDFSDYAPIISGTYPLNINTPTSDVDILMSSSNLDTFKEILTYHFQTFTAFSINRQIISNNDSLVLKFKFDGVDFEIFVQQKDPILQNANLHFLVEERLLKLGGASFLEKIKQLKLTGLKTEHAFAQVLNLYGNPFVEIIKIQKHSEDELRALIKAN